MLSSHLKQLNDFPLSAKEQIRLSCQLATKLCIQGVQPKLSALLNTTKNTFEIVEKEGHFILKPPHAFYEELPQNEDLTMKLAAQVGIETPLHGMIHNIDGSLTYFIKRFDRGGTVKVAVEDLSQALESSRETKYASSMEKVAFALEKFCSFPLLEKMKLFRLAIFNFLVGNEDMHLKNFMLIEKENKVELIPAYDLVNTTLVLATEEEIALPIRGKKNRLTRLDLVDYFGKERLGLEQNFLEKELLKFSQALEGWKALLAQSFLLPQTRDRYEAIIQERWQRLFSTP